MSKKNLSRRPTPSPLPRQLALKEELIAVTLTVVATTASEERNPVGKLIARAGVDLDPSLDLTPLLIATVATVIVIGVTTIVKAGTIDATGTVRVATATTIGATTAAPPRHLTSADHLTETIAIDLMTNVAHLADRTIKLQSLLSM